MSTIIKELETKSNQDLLDEIENLKNENLKLEEKVDELEDEINDQDSYIDVQDCIELDTALGKIHFHNQTGNLMLQREIDGFAELLKQKYN